MGEYAIRKSDGAEIKIGTCESMYYLRYEDKDKVKKIPHSLDANTEKNLFWRLPFPDEDNILPGQYDNHNRGERLYKDRETESQCCKDFSCPETIDSPGIIQLTHPSGLLVNMPCYHGEKLPEGLGDLKTFWNGRSWFYELSSVKNTEEGILPIVHCRFCNHAWRLTWDEIMPYLHGELKTRLEKHNKQS